ncbi:hypothetical protein STENM327S_00584 [Streptomyces tendae]
MVDSSDPETVRARLEPLAAISDVEVRRDGVSPP